LTNKGISAIIVLIISNKAYYFSLGDIMLEPKNLTPAFDIIDQNVSSTRNYIEQLANTKNRHAPRSLILLGPAGIGKSSIVTNTLRDMGKVEMRDYVILKGKVSPLDFYRTLYACRSRGDILVLDDIDNIFTDVNMANLVKAATDSTDGRLITWRSNRTKAADQVLKEGEIPNEFMFNGSVIICSNNKYDPNCKKRNSMSEHIRAVMDRSSHPDLLNNPDDVKSRKEYLLHGIYRLNILERFKLADRDVMLIAKFIETYATAAGSLRTVVKTAEQFCLDSTRDKTKWQMMSRVAFKGELN
jgi:hypothetical protein